MATLATVLAMANGAGAHPSPSAADGPGNCEPVWYITIFLTEVDILYVGPCDDGSFHVWQEANGIAGLQPYDEYCYEDWEGTWVCTDGDNHAW